MTTADQTTRETVDPLLSPDNCALVIIDFQPIQVTSIASMDRRELVSNVVAVAKTAELFALPVVISTVNVETGFNKPTIRQLREIFPNVPTVDRTTLNAWEDARFRKAVEATGRKKLVVVALWTEVCLTFPVLSALASGYEVYPVVDAVGGTSVTAHSAALKRVIQAGARPVSWVQLICELQRDWNRHTTAQRFAEILFAVEGQ
jgi:nicotinamidase-related amidase